MQSRPLQQPDPKPLSAIPEVDHLITLLDSGIRGICKTTYRGKRYRPKSSKMGIHDLSEWQKINARTLKCVGHEKMEDGVDWFKLAAPAVPTLVKWTTSGWAASLLGKIEIAGPRALRVVDKGGQTRKNEGMKQFEEAEGRYTASAEFGEGKTRFKHTLEFRLDESTLRTSSLYSEADPPNQVHYRVRRKIQRVSEIDDALEPISYRDVFSLYLLLRPVVNPHKVVQRALGKSVNVMKS